MKLTRVHLRKICFTNKGGMNGAMVEIMKVSGNMEKCMAKVNIDGQMENNI